MKIQILGAGCDKCDALYANTVQAVRNLGIDAGIEKVEDLMQIVMFGVLEAPALAVDGQVLVRSRVPGVKELEDLLRRQL